MRKSIPESPYPCPSWCAGHADPLHEQFVDDRRHDSDAADIDLSLHDPLRDERGRYVAPMFARVYLAQKAEHAAPRVFVQKAESRNAFRLTLEEASRLRDALTEVIEEAAVI